MNNFDIDLVNKLMGNLKEGKDLRRKYMKMILSSTVTLNEEKIELLARKKRSQRGNNVGDNTGEQFQPQILEFNQTQPDPQVIKQACINPVLQVKQIEVEDVRIQSLIGYKQSPQKVDDSLESYNDNSNLVKKSSPNSSINPSLLFRQREMLNKSMLDQRRNTEQVIHTHRSLLSNQTQNKSLGDLMQMKKRNFKNEKGNTQQLTSHRSILESLYNDSMLEESSRYPENERKNSNLLPCVSTLSNIIKRKDIIQSIKSKCQDLDYDLSSSSKIIQAAKHTKAVACMNGLDVYKSESEIKQLKLKKLNKKIREFNSTLLMGEAAAKSTNLKRYREYNQSLKGNNNFEDDPYNQTQNLKYSQYKLFKKAKDSNLSCTERLQNNEKNNSGIIDIQIKQASSNQLQPDQTQRLAKYNETQMVSTGCQYTSKTLPETKAFSTKSLIT
eukprot:403374698